MTWLVAKINEDPKKHIERTQRWRRNKKEALNILLGSSRCKRPGRKPKHTLAHLLSENAELAISESGIIPSFSWEKELN
jgi:hypothetical protein